MKIKTLLLESITLDYFVAKCQWGHVYTDKEIVQIAHRQRYSKEWAQGGPIIESEGIELRHNPYAGKSTWWLAIYPQQARGMNGPTPLVAAMRCYVASKFGDDVDIPAELF